MIEIMRSLDANPLSVYIPSRSSFDPKSGFHLTLWPESRIAQRELRRTTDDSLLFSLGQFSNFRLISLERDTRLRECDWNARIRLWFHQRNLFSAVLLRHTGLDYVEFQNCYAWGQDGIRWVYMTLSP